jgi:hypothetical protein
MFALVEGLGSSETREISVLNRDYAELASRVKESRFVLSRVRAETD